MTWSRRRFFGLTAVAAAAQVFGLERIAHGIAAQKAKATYADNIYTRLLGVRPVVGAFETLSSYGNSRMPPEVVEAMAEAQAFFVDMEELNRAAGARIAQVLKTEAAMVTSSAYGAMLLGAAACLTGSDRARVQALPQVDWPRRECVMQRAHRFVYDRAYRAAGMTIVEADTREQVASAVGPNTAMIAVLGMVERDPRPEVMTPKELIDLGKRADVPVLVDAAGEIPPVEGLTRHSAMGADLMVFSGGKALRGPSSTGILAGRRDLIDAALVHASPNQNIGRGQKVNREEIVGLVVALERYVKLDHATLLANWRKKARYIADELRGISGLHAQYTPNSRGFADVVLTWDRTVIPVTDRDVGQRLRDGTTRIAYMTGKIPYAYANPTVVTSSLEDGEEVIVAARLREFFTEEARRSRAPGAEDRSPGGPA